MAWFNFPAIFITAIITVVLVIGIRESAGFNAAMVFLNIAVILAVVGIGVAYIDPRTGTHSCTRKKDGTELPKERAGSFSHTSGLTRSRPTPKRRGAAAQPGHGHHGRLAICTILYVAVAVVLTGMVPYR